MFTRTAEVALFIFASPLDEPVQRDIRVTLHGCRRPPRSPNRTRVDDLALLVVAGTLHLVLSHTRRFF